MEAMETSLSEANETDCKVFCDQNRQIPPKLGSLPGRKLPSGTFDPQINMEAVGRRATSLSLGALYGVIILISTWLLYNHVRYADTSSTTSQPCFAQNGTAGTNSSDSSLPGMFYYDCPDSGVYHPGGFFSTVSPADEVLGGVQLVIPPFSLHSTDFALEFLGISPWEDQVSFLVDVELRACLHADSSCDEVDKLKLIWRNEKAPLHLSAKNVGEVQVGDRSTTLYSLKVHFMHLWSKLPLNGVKHGFVSILLHRKSASETLQANCGPATELCSVQVTMSGTGPHSKESFIIVAVLMCSIIAFDSWWITAMFRLDSQPSQWPRQQQWLLFASIGLFLFANPILLNLTARPDLVTAAWAFIAESVTFAGGWLVGLSFACFIDMPKRFVSTRVGFYGPKIACCVLGYSVSIAALVAIYADLWSNIDKQSYVTTVQSWSANRQSILVIFGTLRMLVSYFALFWCFWTTYWSTKVMDRLPYALTRTLQLQFRYFGLVVMLIALISILGLVALMLEPVNRIPNFSSFDLWDKWASVVYSSVSNNVASYLFIFIAVFVFTVQFLFMPVKASRLHFSSRRDPYCLCEVDEVHAISSAPHAKSERPILVIERARWLMWLAKESYFSYDDEECWASQTKMVDLSLHQCQLIAALREPEGNSYHDTHCIIARHIPTNRLIISWRGTASSKQMRTDLEVSKISINLGLFLTTSNRVGSRCCGRVPDAERDVFDAAVTGATVAAARAADIAANAMGTIACTPPAERSGTDHYEKVEGKIKAKNLLDRDTHLPQYIWNALRMSGRTIKDMQYRHSHGFVHFGFWSSYNRMRERVHRIVTEELLKSPAELYVTGHSLGGALATHCAYDMALWVMPAVNVELRTREWSGEIPAGGFSVHMYNFGSPRVAGPMYARHYNMVVPDTYRIISDGDLVTGMPAAFMGFCHVGIAAYVDNKGSGSVLVNPMPLESHLNVKTTVNVSAHRLSAYQRALDGCIDPVLAESTIGDRIREAYQGPLIYRAFDSHLMVT